MLVIPFYMQLWLLFAKKDDSSNTNSASTISVIIPFRNEYDNLISLANCLNALKLIPGDEVFLIDDQSTDNGASLLENLRAECCLIAIPEGSKGSKKEALRIGINLAQNDWILTTDADCEMSSEWLNTWRTEIGNNRDFVAGQIALRTSSKSILDLFISCEHLALQLVTKASINRKVPLMCSGANLMFRKSLWETMGGYASHRDLASGDDVLFMRDVARFGGRIAFADNKETCVYTKSAANFTMWLQQRIRWMSKSSHIDTINSRFHAILLLIWLFVFPVGCWYFGLYYFLIIIPESLVLRIASPIKLNVSDYLFWPFFRLLYPLMVLFLYAASFFVKLTWKDRRIASET